MTESNIKLDFDLIEKSLAKEFQFYSPTYIVGRTIDQINIDRAIDIAVSNFNSYNKEVFYSISKNLGELLDAKICFLDIDDCPCEDMYYTIKHLSSDNELLKSTTIKAIEKDLYIKAPTTEHPIDYSIQVSFKGKEAYTDLRFKISEKAIGGWRFNNLKPNVIKKDIDSLSTAKKLLKNFSLNGNKYFDPLMKPKNIIAEPMDEHDISWLNLGDLEVKSEENKNKEEEESKSFIVTVEKGLLDYGVQLPYFHEYFLAGKNFFGQLRLRSIESDGRDLEGKDSIPAGKSFWIGTFDRNVNPYLLTKRSIEKKAKPLDGTCGIPSSLKKDIPKEYHYWEENDIKKAFEIRKSLVASKLISADSIQYHKELNAFRLVHKKMFLGVDVALLKKDCFTNFELKQQDWLGDDNQAKRSAWFLSFKSLDLPTLELQSMNIEKAIGQELKNNLYFVSGDIEPDTKYNTAKSISSTIRNIDSGNVEFIVKSSDNFSAIFKGLTLEGEYIFTREEPESKYWFITKKNDDIVDEQCSLVEIEEGFVCKNYIGYDVGIEKLKPFSLFSPNELYFASKGLNDIANAYAQNPYRSIGYTVQPLTEGLRCIVQGKDGKFIVYHVSEKGLDLFEYNDAVYKELQLLHPLFGDFVLDCILSPKKQAEDKETLFKNLESGITKEDYSFSILHVVYSSILDIQNSSEQYFKTTKAFDTSEQNMFQFYPVKKFTDANSMKKIIKEFKSQGYSGDFLIKTENDAYSKEYSDKWIVFKEYRSVNCVVLDRKDPDGRQKNYMYSLGLLVDNESYSRHPQENIISYSDNFYTKCFKSLKSKESYNINDIVTISFKTASCNIKNGIFVDIDVNIDTIKSFDGVVSQFDDFLLSLHNSEIDIDKLELDYISVCKGMEERYVLGIVLEPEIVDGQNEVVSIEEIRQACYSFMENYKKLGVYHIEENKGRLAILENYIAPVDFELGKRSVKKGTWLMGIRIIDDDLWKKVKDGKITGLSIFGRSRRVPNKKKGVEVRNI